MNEGICHPCVGPAPLKSTLIYGQYLRCRFKRQKHNKLLKFIDTIISPQSLNQAPLYL